MPDAIPSIALNSTLMENNQDCATEDSSALDSTENFENYVDDLMEIGAAEDSCMQDPCTMNLYSDENFSDALIEAVGNSIDNFSSSIGHDSSTDALIETVGNCIDDLVHSENNSEIVDANQRIPKNISENVQTILPDKTSPYLRALCKKKVEFNISLALRTTNILKWFCQHWDQLHMNSITDTFK